MNSISGWKRSSSMSDFSSSKNPLKTNKLPLKNGIILLVNQEVECYFMSRFKPIKRDMDYLFPPSMSDWLPEQHLARFIVEIVEQLDLKPMERAYGTRRSAPFHPALLLSILVYGYATGIFSSRKLENATYDSVAFRFVAADEHPATTR